MNNIAKPLFKTKDVFNDCVGSVNNAKLKSDYLNCLDEIQIAEKEFILKAPKWQLYQIIQKNLIFGSISKKQMNILYTYRMVSNKMPGYKYYNKIKISSRNGRCPLCSVRIVSTLDHFLPKSKYPIYSITPVNLVPACSTCNSNKKTSFPTSESDQTLHPYYDNVENESWIKCSIIQSLPISLNYEVKCPDYWSVNKKMRVKSHFDSYNINELFSSHANEELRGLKVQLQKLYNLEPDLLFEHIKDSYESRLSLGVNSWQACMYYALLKNDWFNNGGVLTL